jgi:hypothetical protein
MSVELIALFCIVELSAEKLSKIISTAYESDTEASPNILFINDPDIVDGPKLKDPTNPPIPKISEYPFLSKSPEKLNSFIHTIPEDWPISTWRFLIADEETTENDSLLCVETKDSKSETLRLDAKFANSIPISLEIGTLGMAELQDNVDDDGVYRGGHFPVEKGRPAPKKELK